MTPEQRNLIKDIFLEASELAGEDRVRYVDQASGGDTEVRAEVEKLLAHSNPEDGILGVESIGELLFRGTRETPTFAIGDTVGGRYRITKLIGAGGMGEVYEAEDLELGTRNAIKTVRSNLLADERFTTRFRREIKLARRVTHPNVCRIHDLGVETIRNQRVVYLTMELLEGETLSALLKRGPMKPEQAIPIIRQIAAALEALHTAKVIHRDLKPSNIILLDSPEGPRPVITDFGLAHVLEGVTEDTISIVGQILGTPAYAAPEQLTAKNVGPEADIYALGIVMYEMLTQRRPFDGETPLESAAQKLAKSPEPPSRFALLDSRWDEMILHCLEREPEKRIRNTQQLLTLLAAIEETPATLSMVTATAERGERPRLRPMARIATVLAILILVLIAVIFSKVGAPIRRSACAAFPGVVLVCDLPQDKDIAVFPFQIVASSKEDRVLALGFEQYMREGFNRLAPNPDKMCVHLRPDQASEGVHLVLEGQIEASHGGLKLRARIRESAQGSKPLDLRFFQRSWTKDSLGGAYRDSLTALASALEIRYPSREWEAWLQGAPQQADSARSYFLGLGYLQTGVYEEAASAFNALIDPTLNFAFAPAQVGLGDAYRFLFNQRPEERVWEVRARRAYQRAAPLDRDFGFGGAEKGLGELDAAEGETKSAIEHFKAALQLWPFDHPLQKRLVTSYENLNLVDEAESVLLEARKRTPECWLIPNTLASLYSRREKWQEAEKSFLELIRLTPDNGTAFVNLSVDYIKTGRFDDAIEMMSKLLQIRSFPMAYSVLGRAYLLRGCPQDGLLNLRKAVELDPDYYLYSANLADGVFTAEPGSRAAVAACNRAIQLCKKALEKNPTDDLVRSRYALNLARVGDTNESLVQSRRVLAHSDGSDSVRVSAAEALDAAGQRTEALSVIEAALRAGSLRTQIEFSAGLAALRHDRRFGELLSRLHLTAGADTGVLVSTKGRTCPESSIPGKGLLTK